MAIYWEGTVPLSGLAAGDYRAGALVQLALPQDVVPVTWGLFTLEALQLTVAP
jgi:hypothetical protein